jgi:hypothetical protein
MIEVGGLKISGHQRGIADVKFLSHGTVYVLGHSTIIIG